MTRITKALERFDALWAEDDVPRLRKFARETLISELSAQLQEVRGKIEELRKECKRDKAKAHSGYYMRALADALAALEGVETAL